MKEDMYKVVVLGGYSGTVAIRYFETKQKMLTYVSKVFKNASKVEVYNLNREASRWGEPIMEEWENRSKYEYSRAEWA